MFLCCFGGDVAEYGCGSTLVWYGMLLWWYCNVTWCGGVVVAAMAVSGEESRSLQEQWAELAILFSFSCRNFAFHLESSLERIPFRSTPNAQRNSWIGPFLIFNFFHGEGTDLPKDWLLWHRAESLLESRHCWDRRQEPHWACKQFIILSEEGVL